MFYDEPDMAAFAQRARPSDMSYALGNLGQFVAVLPSQHLVIVRLGRSHRPHFGAAAFERLVADCVSAIGSEAEKAAPAR